MACVRVSRPLKLLIYAVAFILCSALYFYGPLIEEEWVLWRLANYNPITPASNSGAIDHAPFPENFKGKQLAFHQVFEPRKVALVGYNYTSGSKPRKNAPKKVILLYTPWNGVWNTINYYFLKQEDASFKQYGCPNTNCWVTTDKSDIEKADAVVFDLRDLPDQFPTYRKPNQNWIGYIMEAPWQVGKNLSVGNGLFNWTMSYREDSDIVVKYGFIGKRLPNDKESDASKPKRHVKFSQKRSVAWFVSDCKVSSRREDYAKELAKFIDVDVYGTCGTKRCFPSQSSVCYEDVLASYKFYLSFENSICTDYVTEKFFNVLEYGAVPIVFGGADYQRIGPPGAFIDATKFPDPENLAKLLLSVGSHEQSHAKYLEWKKHYRAYLYPWMCYLCDKLHSPPSPSVKRNLYEWWMKGARCSKWTKPEGFVPLE